MKGVDLAIFSVFAVLGLSVELRPVISKDEEYNYSWGGLTMQRTGTDRLYYDGVWPEPSNLGTDEGSGDEKEAKGPPNNEDCPWKPDADGFEGSIVGTALHKHTFAGLCWEVQRDWPFDIVSKIYWMNEPVHTDFAFAHIVVRLPLVILN